MAELERGRDRAAIHRVAPPRDPVMQTSLVDFPLRAVPGRLAVRELRPLNVRAIVLCGGNAIGGLGGMHSVGMVFGCSAHLFVSIPNPRLACQKRRIGGPPHTPRRART